jgi:hypothetical protein
MSTHDSHADRSSDTPIALPLAVVTVSEIGTITVAIDGFAFPPKLPDAAWSRLQFDDLLDAITEKHGRTVRVEIHESDGSVFTDIIRAARAELPKSEPAAAVATRQVRRRQSLQMVEVTGDRFVPGEDIAVVIPISTSESTADGGVRTLVDFSHPASDVTEVMLVGRISGNVIVRQLP